MKLFLKISDLCDHDISTSRADRQHCRNNNTVLCVASHSKNWPEQAILKRRITFYCINLTFYGRLYVNEVCNSYDKNHKKTMILLPTVFQNDRDCEFVDF